MHQVYGDGCVDALHVFLSDKNIRDLPTQCQSSVLLHPPSLLDLLNYPGEMSSEATTCPARSSCNTTSTCHSVCVNPARVGLATMGAIWRLSWPGLVAASRMLARLLHGRRLSSSARPSWEHTLNLPRPTMPVRLKDRQAADRQLLPSLDVYSRQSHRVRGDYTILDGPPFANGDLHIGHAFNRLLKDIVARYKMLRGQRVR